MSFYITSALTGGCRVSNMSNNRNLNSTDMEKIDINCDFKDFPSAKSVFAGPLGKLIVRSEELGLPAYLSGTLSGTVTEMRNVFEVIVPVLKFGVF